MWAELLVSCLEQIVCKTFLAELVMYPEVPATKGEKSTPFDSTRARYFVDFCTSRFFRSRSGWRDTGEDEYGRV